MLLRHLPPDAALWRSMDAPAQWGHAEALLARIAHGVESGNWQRGRGKGRRPKPPQPPGTKSAATRTWGTALDIAEMRHVLDTWGDATPVGPDGKPLEEVSDGS